ncbi:MAG: hypothetical protein ACYSU6_10055 [Planctomycetota bacterium]|jgi:hypothetical protein
MAIEAPLSKFKKNNFIIYIVICLGLASWCAYDGFFNDGWIEEHTDADGNPEAYLVFNRKAPAFFVGAAVLFGVYLFLVRDKKVMADENELIISNREKISYDAIEKIDKTHFAKKGFFVITYKREDGGEARRKLSDKTYDNLADVLDELVAKIT